MPGDTNPLQVKLALESAGRVFCVQLLQLQKNELHILDPDARRLSCGLRPCRVSMVSKSLCVFLVRTRPSGNAVMTVRYGASIAHDEIALVGKVLRE